MNVAETRLCLVLHSLPELDDSTLARLLLHFGSLAAVARSDPSAWRELGLSRATRDALSRALKSGACSSGRDIDAQLDALLAAGAHILALCDAGYPPLLRMIYDAPPLLYVRGEAAALAAPQLAVVGSRRASPAGLRAAGCLCGQATRAGLAICSGLALGIDAAAHRGALAAGGKSVAVLATGIDRTYPARHGALALELAEAGAVVTEFPPGMQPLRQNFPRRNRIISGLSLGALVIEAAHPSGSLITARTALEQGREVFALPWSIFHERGAGCLRLLRDGAKMVQNIDDVLEELGPLYALQRELAPAAPREEDDVTLSPGLQRVLALVGYERVAADELARHSALPVPQLLADLSELELQGLIQRGADGYIRT